MTPKLRVLVVEDSLTVRRYLCDVLAADASFEVVGEAADGKQAITLCQSLRPHVVTMDMMLPVMSGLSATEFIMAHCPTPILIVSSSTNRGELFKTYEALAAGAVDVLEKPAGTDPDGEWERDFKAAIRMVARIRVVTHLRARLPAIAAAATIAPNGQVTPRGPAGRFEVAVIGASTGGPAAIVEVLRGLPADFTLPLLFVLHINEPFGIAFAEWLDGQTARRVGYARAGELVRARAGQVTMAPPDFHMEVHGGRVHLTQAPPRHSCRPSIDVLFESIARDYGPAAIACLLTGMGRDGAAGLLAIRRAGGLTIGQDEASSVVYGMPREAMLLGAVEQQLPLSRVGPAIAQVARE